MTLVVQICLAYPVCFVCERDEQSGGYGEGKLVKRVRGIHSAGLLVNVPECVQPEIQYLMSGSSSLVLCHCEAEDSHLSG